MLLIDEQDTDKLLPARNRNQCIWNHKKRTRKYDGWVAALKIKVRLDVD